MGHHKGGLGTLLSVAAPLVLSAIAPGLGTAIGTGLGLSEGAGAATVGSGLIGAGAGAAGGALGGGGLKGALKGAALGGVGGAIAPNLGDIANAVGVGDTAQSVGESLGLAGETAQATGNAGTSFNDAAGSLTGGANTAEGAVAAGSGAGGAAGGIAGGGGNVFASALGIDPTLDTSGIDQLAAQVAGSSAPMSTTGVASGLTPAEQGFLNNAMASSGVNSPAAISAIDSASPAALASVAGDTPSSVNAGGSGLMHFLSKNSNLIMPAAAIGASALQGDKQPKGEKQLMAQAGQTNAIGSELANTINSGKLPAGAESMVQQAISDGEASIRSKYAQMGMSGSTMEAQEIQALHERAQSMRFSMASDLTKTGLTALNSSSAIYQALMQQQLQQDQNLSDSISGLAEASALGNALSKA